MNVSRLAGNGQGRWRGCRRDFGLSRRARSPRTLMTMSESRTTTIRLRDGRRLAYAEWGDTNGFPIVHCHGMPGSRLEHEADDGVYASLGVRVITPDRPGYGLSDSLPGRRLVDWPADVAELADLLEMPRFAMTALSGGGVFALACAAQIPERLTGVVTAGCPAPMYVGGLNEGVKLRFRAGLSLAAHASWLVRAGAEAMAVAVRRRPEFFVVHANQDNPTDLRWLALPSVRAEATEMIQEGFRSGARGYIDDVVGLARPWGFALEGIRVPVHLWHGDADTVIPIRQAAYLAAMIPLATLTICPGEGHMLMWNHLPEILEMAKGRKGLDRSSPSAPTSPREAPARAAHVA